MQTDGYIGYDWVDGHSDIIHLGCMSHARRPFAELVKLAKTTGKSYAFGEIRVDLEKAINLS